MSLSSSSTSACMPRAIAAAFIPATPAPMTTTLAAYTPETPPMRMPRPPSARMRACAPTWGARRPATSDIGASSGRRPVRQLDGLVGDSGDLARDELLGQGLVGREVEVREQHLSLAHPGVLLGDRFLHLEDEVRRLPHVVSRAEDGGTGRDVVLVADRGAAPCVVLHQDLVAIADELVHAGGRDGHAVLVVLDLAWDTDLHVRLILPITVGPRRPCRTPAPAGHAARSHCSHEGPH